MRATRTPQAWDCYAWAAGLVFVVALATEAGISFGFEISQDDSPAKIARSLHDHHTRLLLVASLCAIYAIAFPIYLARLHSLLRGIADRPQFLGSLVLTGGTIFITLHAVSDVGIYFLLAGKIAAYSALHDPGVSYTLYLLTFALDSVGDLFGSLFLLATGLLVLASRVLPRLLGWVAIVIGILFFFQAFGLGGVVANFGLALDGVGFVLFLLFVAVSSVVMLAREGQGLEATDLP